MEDMILDNYFYIENEDISVDTYPMNISYFNGEPDYGRVPAKKNEVLVQVYEDSYLLDMGMVDQLLDQKFDLYLYNDTVKVKVVGIDIMQEEQVNYSFSGTVYMTQEMINHCMRELYILDSTITTTVNENQLICEWGGPMYKPVPLADLDKGEAIVPEEFDMYYNSGRCTGHWSG